MTPPLADQTLRFQLDSYAELATHTAAPDVWRDWDVLADTTAAAPFLRPGWFRAWHRAYGQGELQLLTVRRGNDLAGVLPLELRGRATLSTTNTHSPLFGPLATDPDAEWVLASQLVDQSGGRIELAYVDPTTSWFSALETALALRGRRPFVDTVLRSPYVVLGDSDHAYPARLSRRFAKELRRCRRRLEEQGGVSVTLQTSVRGLDRALDEFVALESSGWKASAGTAIASRDASRRFYAEIAEWAAQRGWLRLAFLRLDGKPIAAELDLESAGRMYALKSGFDPEYRGFGPGQLLTRDCIELACAAGLSSYEFLGTDEPYKMSWTDDTRERVRVQAFPAGPRGRLQALSRRRIRPALRRLRRR